MPDERRGAGTPHSHSDTRTERSTRSPVDAPYEVDNRWRPTPEAIGGAISGGAVGSLLYGPVGSLVGMAIGVIAAVATTRYLASRSR